MEETGDEALYEEEGWNRQTKGGLNSEYIFELILYISMACFVLSRGRFESSQISISTLLPWGRNRVYIENLATFINVNTLILYNYTPGIPFIKMD